jgi:hypothetical protein
MEVLNMAAFDGRIVHIPFYLADVSTAGQIYVPIPDNASGKVVEIRAALNGAIATANAVLTAKIDNVTLTNGGITIAHSGSAAGQTFVSRPTANNNVSPGKAVEIETNGASTNTVEVFGVISILR